MARSSHDDRIYAAAGDRLFGPFATEKRAAEAINRAAAAVAIGYAGLGCSVEEALAETFGAGDDADERDRRTDRYYNAALNLLDGAASEITDRLLKDVEDIEEHFEFHCPWCHERWTGTEANCWNCQQESEAAENATELALA